VCDAIFALDVVGVVKEYLVYKVYRSLSELRPIWRRALLNL